MNLIKHKILVPLFATIALLPFLISCQLDLDEIEVPTPVPSTPTAMPVISNAPLIGDGPNKTTTEWMGQQITQYMNVPWAITNTSDGKDADLDIDPAKTYHAIINTTMGEIEIELLAQIAPLTVNNFVFLSEEGFYDGVVFHRVIPEFMIQTGDPTGTGTGSAGYRFKDEFDKNTTFDRTGVLAMANSGPGTNGSQFFLTVESTPHLNYKHTIFGYIVNGQEIADAISIAPTEGANKPITEISINSITIKTE